MKVLRFLLGALIVMSVGPRTAFSIETTFAEHCENTYQRKKSCPDDCQLQCADGAAKTADCQMACVPRDCKTISVESCPKDFCSIVMDCSQQKNCLPKVPEDQVPECGSLAYSAQDVACCKGLVKRCGFDYLDGSCNMEGKNTAYRFPICVPCGDGACTNFENHCNCPEDCPKEIIPLN